MEFHGMISSGEATKISGPLDIDGDKLSPWGMLQPFPFNSFGGRPRAEAISLCKEKGVQKRNISFRRIKSFMANSRWVPEVSDFPNKIRILPILEAKSGLASPGLGSFLSVLGTPRLRTPGGWASTGCSTSFSRKSPGSCQRASAVKSSRRVSNFSSYLFQRDVRYLTQMD